MANQTTVQLKRSSVAGRVPDAANIDVGEPVVNLNDKIIFTKDGNGNVIVIGAGTTSNVVEGNNLYFTDTRVNSSISNQTLTNATFTGNVVVANLLPPSDDSGAVGNASRTWNNGHFTNLTIDTLTSVSGTLNVRTALDLGTDDILRLGDNDDIEIYHDGTNSYVDLNTGNLIFRDVVSNRATFVRHTGDLVLSTGNAQANYFIGNGSALTNVRVSNSNITGNIISSQIQPTGVTAATYGNATLIPSIVVDQQGRITSASNVAVVAPAATKLIVKNRATSSIEVLLTNGFLAVKNRLGATINVSVT